MDKMIEPEGQKIIITKSKVSNIFYVKNRYGTARYDLKGYGPIKLKAWRLRILSGFNHQAQLWSVEEEE